MISGGCSSLFGHAILNVAFARSRCFVRVYSNNWHVGLVGILTSEDLQTAIMGI